MQISDIKDKVAVQLQCSWSFAEGRGIGWSTSVPLDIPSHELDAVLDKLRLAIERQDYWYKYNSIETLVAREEERLAKTISNLKSIDERYEGQLDRMTRDDRDVRKNLVGTLFTQNRDLEIYRAQMADIKARLNGQGA
ncbi:MAG: hypothetical protein C5B60_01505 [Chloroflexi bacterium]|nr:MAG: hypothetical protein C5B60_01505 [Chloroflexota bacterium]